MRHPRPPPPTPGLFQRWRPAPGTAQRAFAAGTSRARQSSLACACAARCFAHPRRRRNPRPRRSRLVAAPSISCRCFHWRSPTLCDRRRDARVPLSPVGPGGGPTRQWWPRRPTTSIRARGGGPPAVRATHALTKQGAHARCYYTTAWGKVL